jgi:EAL domain-containing protein (putative c-di-GMP-specific phosphodiesterase class I)
LAHAIGLTVIAEGVETAVQLEMLAEFGCDQAQGFYLGKPQTAADIARTVATHPSATDSQ